MNTECTYASRTTTTDFPQFRNTDSSKLSGVFQ
jgi:hypothetical protein